MLIEARAKVDPSMQDRECYRFLDDLGAFSDPAFEHPYQEDWVRHLGQSDYQFIDGHAGTTGGLAGMGDLVLTCTGELSRNRRVGQRLGRGERLEEILARSHSVAEGVRTTRSARELACRAGVEMPIVNEVYRILYEEGRVQEGLERLLSRPLTSEEEALRNPDR